jgi:hypothetical protein
MARSGALIIALLVVGCGGGGKSGSVSAPSQPTAFDDCLRAHGIDLLTGAQARRVVPAVSSFIRSG